MTPEVDCPRDVIAALLILFEARELKEPFSSFSPFHAERRSDRDDG